RELLVWIADAVAPAQLQVLDDERTFRAHHDGLGDLKAHPFRETPLPVRRNTRACGRVARRAEGERLRRRRMLEPGDVRVAAGVHDRTSVPAGAGVEHR